MKNKTRKRILVIAALALCLNGVPLSAYAASAGAQEGCEVMSADKIVKRYRTSNGKRQYRRWNATKKRWVDPHWIDV